MRMKFIVLFASLAAVVALTACKSQEPDIAVVDPAAVFKSCTVCVEGQQYLQAKGQGMQQQLAEMQAAAQNDTSEDAAQKFQERYTKMQMELMADQSRIAETLNNAFLKALEDYRTANKVSAILAKENVLSVGEGADATEAIIAAMNNANLDLKLVADDAAPEAPAEAPAPEAEKAQ